MTSRIESYTVGGQVLASESVRQEVGEILRIDSEQVVFPKGAGSPIKVCEVGGIAGQYNLALEKRDSSLVTLTRQIPIKYQIHQEIISGGKNLEGSLIRLSKKCAEVISDGPVEAHSNLKMNIRDVDESLALKYFYGKVVECPDGNEKTIMVCFTSVPPEVDAYFQSHRQHSTKI